MASANIVSTRFKPAQHIIRLAACRQHEDRNESSLRAQLVRQRKPIHAGQHHVEDHHVKSLLIVAQQRKRFFRSADSLHLITLGIQVVAQTIGEMFFVFNYQYRTRHYLTLGK